MRFRATEKQVKAMAVLAVEASTPMGMGVLHFKADQKFSLEDFEIRHNQLFLDYVQGRMVKLLINKISEDTWEMRDDVSTEYQSWARKYPTPLSLAQAAGIEAGH